MAPRVAWEIANGREVPEGQVVRHSCDNPPCCNPAHLLAGSQGENVGDMDSRGRRVVVASAGPTHYRSITPEQVGRIHELLGLGCGVRQTAREVGVSPGLIRKVRDGQHWSSRPMAVRALRVLS